MNANNNSSYGPPGRGYDQSYYGRERDGEQHQERAEDAPNNNHHANPARARLSKKWWEFDIGWMYICIFEILGLARVSRR